MTPTDKPEFCKVVLGFAELKGKALSLPAVELYWHAMSEWDLGEFKQAAVHLLKTSEFMPVPKDFEDLRKAGRPTAGEAWARAVGHAASGGYRRGPLGDETVDLLVRGLGGYQAIALCDESRLHFLERRFTEHFDTLSDRIDTRRALPQLTSSDRINSPGTPTGLVKIGRPS